MLFLCRYAARWHVCLVIFISSSMLIFRMERPHSVESVTPSRRAFAVWQTADSRLGVLTEARRPRTCGSLACEHGALARLSLSRLLAWSRGPVSRVIQCDHTCGAPARSRTVVIQTESYFLPFDFP